MTSNNYILRNWDTEFFSRNILDVSRNEIVIGKPYAEGLVTAKVTSDEFKYIDSLGANGFTFCEGETLLSKNLVATSSEIKEFTKSLLVAGENDIGQIQNIVEGLYSCSRFREPWFSEFDKNRFYKEWARKAVLGLFDDFCIITKDEQGNISGFITLKICESIATVGLIGVSPNHQRQGVGKNLLQSAEVAASKKNVKKIKVATQTSNLGAIRLYQELGYSVSEISYWFYKQL